MPQVLSIVRLFQNGTEVTIKPGGSIKIGGLSDEPVVAGQDVYFAAKMEESEVTVKAIVTDGMVISQAFPRGVDLAVAIECDTGQNFSWPAMRIKGRREITAGTDSALDLTYVGAVPMETSAS